MRKLLVLPVVVVVLLVGGVAQAEWRVNKSLDSWDERTLAWAHGNLDMWLDGTPQPFLYSFVSPPPQFNTDLFGPACGTGTSTRYAGEALIGLYHQDTGVTTPNGFQSTANWQLVKCSELNGSESVKKFPAPGDVLATCAGPPPPASDTIGRCDLVSQDVVDGTFCHGNCDSEILTSVRVNLDLDCDGEVDDGFADDVCLYFEAVKPGMATTPHWGGKPAGSSDAVWIGR